MDQISRCTQIVSVFSRSKYVRNCDYVYELSFHRQKEADFRDAERARDRSEHKGKVKKNNERKVTFERYGIFPRK